MNPALPKFERGARCLSALALISLGLFSAVLLHAQGRLWWCACGQPYLWITDAWGQHTSQHLLDPYSFTHVLHGFAFWWVLAHWSRQEGYDWAFVVAVGVESFWEVVENTNFVIQRYRTATAALGYNGDTVANSLGDIACCAVGFVIARQIGWRKSAVIFVVTEAILLVWIRDSFLLDVLMLVYPIEAVKQWQLGQ